MPFIVRLENGYQARDRYAIAVLWQPNKPWDAFDPQPQFNHKLLITHGGSCGASYTPADAPGVEDVEMLGRGFAVMSTALDNTGHNCSLVAGAESLMMAKERIIEQYGTLRYTIGTGCSGGSVAENTIANAYPGIYQGIVTACTYPDVLSPGMQFYDFHLMRLYFENPTKWGVLWSPTQMGRVEGHLSHVNAITSDELLFKQALDPESACPGTQATVAGDRNTRYHTERNPGGVRCSALEMGANIFGPRPKGSWSAGEKKVGFGFTGTPFGNVGVQYGLEPLRRGEITFAQFLDLNEKIGGLDVDISHQAKRVRADAAAVRRSYRSGMMNLGQNMSDLAIINVGGPDPGAAHDYSHAFWMERRLRRVQGGETANRVMWFGAVPLLGDPRWQAEAVLDVDRWLTRVEKDTSSRSLAHKIAAGKPADVTDRCFNLPGLLETEGKNGEVDCVLNGNLQLNLSSPREQAGDTNRNDRLVCDLQPLRRADFDFLTLPMNDTQWQTLQRVFPMGVCDYRTPGPGRVRNQTWLTYADPEGRVVYGGRNLPKVAAGHASGWSAASFASALRR